MREATTLFDQALAHVEKYETNYLERETIRTLTEYGNCLSARGQKMQAVARWQQILDTYPTTEQFDDVEKRIRTVLEAL